MRAELDPPVALPLMLATVRATRDGPSSSARMAPSGRRAKEMPQNSLAGMVYSRGSSTVARQIDLMSGDAESVCCHIVPSR